MNKDRLLALADYMDKVKADTYDQDSFFDFSNHSLTKDDITLVKGVVGGHSDNSVHKITLREGFCGTTACVLGHAAFVPGTTLSAFIRGWDLDEGGKPGDDVDADVGFIDANGQVITGMAAGVHEFGIPRDHCEVMFSDSGEENTRAFYGAEDDWVSPQQVAAAIRNYVATDGQSINDILYPVDDEDTDD